MMSGVDFLINTDRSFEQGDVTTVSKRQYQFRDFSFWTDEAIDRSVTRYQQVVSSRKEAEWSVEPHTIVSLADPVETAPRTNRKPEPVLELPAYFQKRVIGERSVNTLQEWECAILEVRGDTVFAMATSVISREPDQHYIEIPIFEFQPSDHSRLREGVLFRLIIGFVTKANGQRSREAILYIRHQLPRNDTDLSPLLDVLVDD